MRRVSLTVALVLGCTFAVACRQEDPSQPARIVSGSMAERFYGEHWAVVCDDCGFPFRCGVEHPPDERLAICPNCGFRENKIDLDRPLPGMAVEVVPRDFRSDPPRRWEVVAFRQADSDRVEVKRVVGLPGERLAIRGGDLFVDGRRVQKSLVEFRELAQVAYDDRHRPSISWGRSGDLPSQAVVLTGAEDPHPGPLPRAGEGEHDGRIGNPSYQRWRTSGDWLEYHHWSCAATPTPRTADAPIRDNDSYNQGLSRAMNTVGDVVLFLTVGQLSDGEEFLVRLYGGAEPLVVAMTPNEDAVRLLHGDEQLAEAPTSMPLVSSRDWNLTAGVVDGRVLVEIGGKETLALDLDAAGIELAPEDVSLAIGSRDAVGKISNLRVLRDVYYLNPLARPGDWEMAAPLGEGEYFMLGDNPPLSRDSRQFGSIAGERLVGGVR